MRRWRGLVAVLVAVLVLGTAGYAVAQAKDHAPSYRTAVASLGDVQRTLDLSGTVTAAGRRDLSFGTAGSVARVLVHAGQRVSSGQPLARLVSTPFDAAVTSAVATLDRASAQLASDEAAQATAVTAANAPVPPSPSSQSPKSPKTTKPTATNSSPALHQLLAQLTEEQKTVTEAQTSASDAITASKTALGDQTQACRDPSAANASPSTDPQPTDSPDAGTSGQGAGSEACAAALATVQAAQDTVAKQQDALQSALARLGQTLGQATAAETTATTNQSTTTQASTHSSSASSSQPTTAAKNTSTGTRSTGSVTAARLAQDQADIDTGRARLIQAQAEHNAATLRAPYAGRILESGIAAGDRVAASQKAFVLVGHGATTVTTHVTTAQVPAVRRGQSVTVTPAGWTTNLPGTVSAIGLLPDSTSSFPVTVTLSTSQPVAEGTTASVSIITATARAAVTVPVSALTQRGDRAFVQVLSGSTVTTTPVTVGVLGTRRVSLTAGLQAGKRVVLADLRAAVPSGNTTNNLRARFGGGAGFGGGGFGGVRLRSRAGG